MNENLLTAVTEQLKRASGRTSNIPAKPQLKEGENRDIAILFLDLKGFTALSETMDHESLHHLLHDENGVMTSLSRIVDTYGGYIDKFEGDLIMALFGAEHASENDAKRAVSCALELLETVEGINSIFRQFDLQFGARIGVNSGRATVAPDPSGHLTAIGPDVNLASRMESSADVNTIQATAAVYRMTSDDFVWHELGEKYVKGIDHPIATYRPLHSSADAPERWQRSTRLRQVPLVGRALELERLQEIWQRSKQDTRKNPRGYAKHYFIDIVGEPGVGKSRLVHEFLDRMQAGESSEFIVVEGNAASFAQPPFQLWNSMLRRYFDGVSIEDDTFASRWSKLIANSSLPDSRLATCEQVVRRFLTGKASVDSVVSSPETIREEIRIALRDFVLLLHEQRRRVVLVLDDLHWLDSGSQEVLEDILANSECECPVFVIGIHRPDREDGSLLEFTLREKYVELFELKIEPLTQEATAILTQSLAKSFCSDSTHAAFSDAIASLVFQFSQGNPFYAEELLLDWLESKRLEFDNGTWRYRDINATVTLPSTIAALIRSRMDRLPPTERKSLQECAVLGLEFSFRLYRRIKEKLSFQSGVEPTLQSLVFHDYLKTISSIREHAFRFKLTTTHDVAYETVLRENRMLLHKLTAEAMEELYPDDHDEIVEALFRHWTAAGDCERAIPYGIQTLRQYRIVHQVKEANALDCDCEEMFQTNSDKTTTLWKNEYRAWLFLSESLAELTGNRIRQQTLLERLYALPAGLLSGYEQADLSLRWGNFAWRNGDLASATQWYETALTQSGRQDCQAIGGFAIGNLGLIAIQQNDPDTAQKKLTAAIAIFESVNNASGIGVFASNLAGLHYSQNRLDECERYLNLAEDAFHTCRNRRGEANALSNRASLLSKRLQWNEAIRFIRRACELLDLLGDLVSLGTAKSNYGYYCYRSGDNTLAKKLLEEALILHEEAGDNRMKEITNQRLHELQNDKH